MRRLLTVVVVACFTATGSLWWLHDGDLEGAVQPVLTELDDELMKEAAGLWNEQMPGLSELEERYRGGEPASDDAQE